MDNISRGTPEEANKDLWHPIRCAYRAEPVIKIKSHDHAAAERGTADPLHYVANEMADMLADDIADMVEVSAPLCERYLQEKHWAQIARSRIVDINAKIYADFERKEKHDRQEKLKREKNTQEEQVTTASNEAMLHGHWLNNVRTKGKARCIRCGLVGDRHEHTQWQRTCHTMLEIFQFRRPSSRPTSCRMTAGPCNRPDTHIT